MKCRPNFNLARRKRRSTESCTEVSCFSLLGCPLYLYRPCSTVFYHRGRHLNKLEKQPDQKQRREPVCCSIIQFPTQASIPNSQVSSGLVFSISSNFTPHQLGGHYLGKLIASQFRNIPTKWELQMKWKCRQRRDANRTKAISGLSVLESAW